jgi:hypothetical protein
VGWAHGSDLGWGRKPKLHGMQGVSRLISSPDLALETQTARNLRAAGRLFFLK